ncbi:hypothetical protein ACIP9G_10965 [Lysinibacillus sp. NPDC093197]|uniref:hypothetical protein n=1 Tax=Lysinibacillus sp. NPDC093197 TaxID=3364132 RepID=UPI00381905EE
MFTDTNGNINPWINEILHYTGMGQTGAQKLKGNANFVLAETFSGTLTDVHLF